MDAPGAATAAGRLRSARPLPPLTPLAALAGAPVHLRTAQPHAAISCGVAGVRATMVGRFEACETLRSSAAGELASAVCESAAAHSTTFVRASRGASPPWSLPGRSEETAAEEGRLAEAAWRASVPRSAAAAAAGGGAPFVTLPVFCAGRRAEGLVTLDNEAACSAQPSSAAGLLPACAAHPPAPPRRTRPLLLTRHAGAISEVCADEAALPGGGCDCSERDALEFAVRAVGAAFAHEQFPGEARGGDVEEEAATRGGEEERAGVGRSAARRAAAAEAAAVGAAAARARGWIAAAGVCDRIAAQQRAAAA